MGRNLLLIIDPQNDFVNPDGSLYVDGAEKSIKNLCQWINENNKNIDKIFITQDTHMSYHIGHSCFWKEYPKPGTEISYQNVLESDFTPILSREEESSCDLFYDQEILDYFFELDNKNKKHIIWPEHCIEGSWGWCFPDQLVEAINLWSLSKKGKEYEIERKGKYPFKEMYSALSYADESIPENSKLRQILEETKFDNIYIAGVAKDYCVAETVKDLLSLENVNAKLVFLEKCMATIDPNNSSLKIYEEAIEKNGAQSI